MGMRKYPLGKEKENYIKRQNETLKEIYDHHHLTLPKDSKEKIRVYANRKGLSINAYINKLIAEDMEKNSI
ncbi:MAG: hypothetical protein QM689_08720 [Oscillospiraceae bacterium]